MSELAGRVDVALLPVSGWGLTLGRGHLDPWRAAEAAALIRPAIATPIHWGTLHPLGLRRLARRRFEGPGEAFREAVAARAAGVEVRVLAAGAIDDPRRARRAMTPGVGRGICAGGPPLARLLPPAGAPDLGVATDAPGDPAPRRSSPSSGPAWRWPSRMASLPGLSIDGLAPLLLAGLLLLALDSASALVLHRLLVGLADPRRPGPGPARPVRGDHRPPVGAAGRPRGRHRDRRLGSPAPDGAQQPVRRARGGERRRLLLQRARPAPGGPRLRACPKEPEPGLLVVQVDGLSLPVLQQAIRAGRVPVLGRLVRDGEAKLHPWIAMLPPTTPASQAGILHGRQRRHRRLPLVREGERQAAGGKPPGRCGRDRPSHQRRRGPAGRRRGQHRQPGDRRRSAELPDHGHDLRGARRPTTSGGCAASSSPPSTTFACSC